MKATDVCKMAAVAELGLNMGLNRHFVNQLGIESTAKKEVQSGPEAIAE